MVFGEMFNNPKAKDFKGMATLTRRIGELEQSLLKVTEIVEKVAGNVSKLAKLQATGADIALKLAERIDKHSHETPAEDELFQ